MCVRCRKGLESVPEGEASESIKALLERGERYQKMNIWELKVAAKEDGEDSGGEEFLPQELIMAAALAAAFHDAGKAPTKKLLLLIKENGIGYLDEAIAEVEPDFSDAFSQGKTEQKITEQLRLALSKGSGLTGSDQEIFRLLQTKEILSDMTKATKYFTNHYFNDHVVPDLHSIVEKLLQGQSDNIDVEGYQAIREAMSARLKNVPYWRLVANASASRGFHYGAVKAGMSQGYKAYQIVAVLDDRTSKICQHMNGKEFWVADAELQVVRAALAQGDEIKFVAPWLSEGEIIGKNANELREAGFIIPPFHGNCRSTIRFVE